MKKKLWLCIIIIFMCSLIGAAMPFGKEKQTYTTEADIELGSYDNSSFNNANQVVQMVTNKAFYDQYVEKDWFELINKSLVVAVSANNSVHFTYTGSNEEESLGNLTKVIQAFLKLDQEHFSQKKSIIQENITALGKMEVSPDTAVDKQRFLYELQNSEIDMVPASIVKDVSLIEKSRTLSAKDRGVLGALIGITFSFIWVLWPGGQTRYPKTYSSKRKVSSDEV
ncbi:hypothetical protein [Niallia sp. 03133]|uniref:hypothetical protein n=1 Tax=Niallia sp. 03133 TaxID=3458060 RepID=UPI004044DB69